jgi:hypothetical protein
MGETIDWKAELRKYEREFDGLPPEPTPGELRAQRLASIAQKEREERDAAAFKAWVRLLLVVVLAGSLHLWPYARDCGAGLGFYLAAETAITIGGVWVAIYTWTHQLGRTHALAFVMALWGMGLLAVEVLPRVGYARVNATHPPTWSCTTSRR